MEKYKDWFKRNITSLKHYDVFKQHYSRMISILPIEDLIPELKKENLLPGNLKEEVDSKVTTEKKVKCFLDSLEGGLKIEKPVKFERFLYVLIDYAEREKDLDVECLLQDIYEENRTTCLETSNQQHEQQCSHNVEPHLNSSCKYSLTFDPLIPIHRSFTKLTTTLLKMFEEQSDVLFTLQMACIQQLHSPTQNYIPQDIISKLKAAKSLRSFWLLLIDSPHCNFLDIRLLEAMADALLRPEAKKIIDNFKDAYYNKTIAEVAPTVPIAPIKSMHCVAVYDNLNLNPREVTIFDLYKHRFFIEEILEADEYIGCHKIRIGSIKITWQIPINFIYKAYCSLEKNRVKLHPWCELLISDIKQWEKLPVLWHGQQVDDNKIGPLKSLLEDIRHKPYTLHSTFKWSALEYNKPYIRSDEYEFIPQKAVFRRPSSPLLLAASYTHQLGDSRSLESSSGLSAEYEGLKCSGTFVQPVFPRKDVTEKDELEANNSITWMTTHPDFWSDLYFGVRVCATNKLVGAALSYPLCITIRETRIKAICIYHKSHVKFVQNRLPYMLIQETMRRAALHGIQHAIFGFHTEAIQPLVIRNTWCYEFNFHSATLPLSTVTLGWRKMKLEDVPVVLKLTNQYTSRFKIRQEFQSEEEFSHYFLNSNISGFICTYVVEDLPTGDITDMVSFRIYHSSDISSGEMVAIVAGKTQPRQLITDTLVCVSKLGLDIFRSKQFGLDSLAFSSYFYIPDNVLFNDHNVVLYNYQHPQIDQDDCWIATLQMNLSTLLM